MRNQYVAGSVSELNPVLTELAGEKKTLERDALCLAVEALSCINIMNRVAIQYFYAG